ncbi:MAG: DNA topoisomerase VI subunit B [archaeon]
MPEEKAEKESGNGAGLTAEQLAKEFKEHSVAEFFKKNKQMLGLTGKIRTLTTIIHEYVTNSLDACEEARVLPEIEVRLSELGEEYYEVMVKDNGPGLTEHTIGKAFAQLLAGTKFHRLMQSRGQQGIGASGCTMLSLMTTGKPIQVITGDGKRTLVAELTIDPKKNEAKIIKMEETKKDFKGTAVKAKFKEVKYQKSEQGPLEYLRRTAIANPHATIIFVEPDGTKNVFARTSKAVPERSFEVKPHPKGTTVDEILTMAKATEARKVSSFLKNDFDRMGEKSIEEITKQVSFDLNKDPKKLEWHETEEIVKAIKGMQFIAPRTDALRPIGQERIEASLREIVQPEFLSVVERKPQVYSEGIAFQVEVAVAFGGNAGRGSGETIENSDGTKTEIKRVEVMRFANRVPLLFDGGGCALTKAVQSVDWKRYGIRDMNSAPLTVFVHILSVHIPYTGAGKQAITDDDAVMEELRLAIMDTGRRIYQYVAGKRREAEKQAKKKVFLKYATEVAIALHDLTGKPVKAIESKLHEIVMKRLKLEEKQEKEVEAELTDEELEKDAKKEAKEKKKGKKRKSALKEEGEGE